MPRDRSRHEEEDEEDENFWKGLGRDLLVAAIIVVMFLAVIYAYARVWPPLVVVESSSMQHSSQESFLGVIDTGDMVFQQAAPTRADVVTYLEGRASGYSTYGDFGDVIIFRRPSSATPVIHRAIMYVTVHSGNNTADIPDLALLPTSEWEATNLAGATTYPYALRTVTIHRMGFTHNFGITFNLASLAQSFAPRSGYVTMGDHNAQESCAGSPDPCPSTPYDFAWLPRQADVIGRARGEIPWFGLLKLTLQPTDSCCPRGWGSTGTDGAPKNSWDSLLVSLIFLLALPFLLEYAMRGWTKYVRPRLPEIRWPWKRRSKAPAPNGDPPDEDADSSDREPDE